MEVGRGLEMGLCPSPGKKFSFLSGIGAFWCILDACFNVRMLVVRAVRRACTADRKLRRIEKVSIQQISCTTRQKLGNLRSQTGNFVAQQS